jgi:hypothetical protein
MLLVPLACSRRSRSGWRRDFAGISRSASDTQCSGRNRTLGRSHRELGVDRIGKVVENLMISFASL